VKKEFSGGALILIRMDGEELPLPVNFDAVKNSMHDDSMIEDATKDIDIVFKFLHFALFDKKYIIWVFINLL